METPGVDSPDRDARTDAPSITVCVSTHHRPELASAAARSVLDQVPRLRLVVCTSNGAEALESLTRSLGPVPEDARVEQIEHRGLSMARNDAAERVQTPWIAFLDEDDELLPGWSRAFHAAMGPDVGLVSCGASFEVDGAVHHVRRATGETVDLLAGVEGLHLAGCFAVRRSIFEEAGRFLPGLPCSHQTEMWIRLVEVLEEQQLRIVTIDEVLTRIAWRPTENRPLVSTRVLFDGGRWVQARHAEHFAALRDDAANLAGTAGVNAARLGRRSESRRFSARAWRLQPLRADRMERMAASLVPAVARRQWGTAPAATADDEFNSLRLVARLARGSEPSPDSLFLPWRYLENPPASADADDNAFWADGLRGNDVRFQVPVYRWTARLLRDGRLGGPLVDIGCGSGHKLHRLLSPLVATVGIDQASGIALARARFPEDRWIEGDLSSDDVWKEVTGLRARTLLCSDVIEHVPDPYDLLARLRASMDDAAHLVISTPDRSRLDDPPLLGPPRNPRHVREWTHEELHLLLEATGFEVLRSRHFLPRSYSASPKEARRLLGRARRGMPLPDRRSSMAFLVRKDTAVEMP